MAVEVVAEASAVDHRRRVVGAGDAPGGIVGEGARGLASLTISLKFNSSLEPFSSLFRVPVLFRPENSTLAPFTPLLPLTAEAYRMRFLFEAAISENRRFNRMASGEL